MIKNSPKSRGFAADNSQQPLNPEDDKDWEGAFSGPDTEDEEIEYPIRLLDDIASDIYVSGFLWDNGLTPRYKVGADGDKVVEIKLKNGETVILKEDKDFCYGYDGTPYFTKEFVGKNGHLALIKNTKEKKAYSNKTQNKPAIEAGSDAKEVLESLGYEVEIYETNTMGRRIFISGNGLKYVIFDGTAGLKADKEGNIIFTSQWENSAQIKQLLNPEKTLEVKESFLKFAEKVQAGGEMTLADIEALYQDYEWVQDLPEVSNALKPLYENEEFVDLLEQCYDNLGLDLYLPETELSAGEMLFYSLYTIISGEVIDSGNSNFDTALKLVNFALMVTPVGVGRKVATNIIVDKAAARIVPKIIDKVSEWLGKDANKILQNKWVKKLKEVIDGLEIGVDVIEGVSELIEGAYLMNNTEMPQWLKTVIDFINDKV